VKTSSAAVKLGVFVAVTSLLTGILAITIANIRFGADHRYKAIFEDVTGLLTKDDVRAAGVRVGQIEKIRLHRGNRAEVTFSVHKDGVFEPGLPRATRLELRFRNLMGQRYLALVDGPGTVDDYLRPGETVPIEQTKKALDLTELFHGFRPLFRALDPQQVNQLATQIVQVLQGEAGTVNSVLTHLASLTNTLANRDQVIGQLIANLNTVLGTIDTRHAEVTRLITDLRGFVSGVSADREAIFDSLSAIEQLTGTTEDLLRDARPDLKRDIAGVNRLADTLADSGPTLDRLFQRTPDRMAGLVNAASYGSWFNFYLCGLDARIRMPGGPVIQTPSIMNENARCKPQ
jgi:phospholipid/cholesterol/gamma-HCH transport system substrate-binding protein